MFKVRLPLYILLVLVLTLGTTTFFRFPYFIIQSLVATATGLLTTAAIFVLVSTRKAEVLPNGEVKFPESSLFGKVIDYQSSLCGSYWKTVVWLFVGLLILTMVASFVTAMIYSIEEGSVKGVLGALRVPAGILFFVFLVFSALWLIAEINDMLEEGYSWFQYWRPLLVSLPVAIGYVLLASPITFMIFMADTSYYDGWFSVAIVWGGVMVIFTAVGVCVFFKLAFVWLEKHTRFGRGLAAAIDNVCPVFTTANYRE